MVLEKHQVTVLLHFHNRTFLYPSADRHHCIIIISFILYNFSTNYLAKRCKHGYLMKILHLNIIQASSDSRLLMSGMTSRRSFVKHYFNGCTHFCNQAIAPFFKNVLYPLPNGLFLRWIILHKCHNMWKMLFLTILIWACFCCFCHKNAYGCVHL